MVYYMARQTRDLKLRCAQTGRETTLGELLSVDSEINHLDRDTADIIMKTIKEKAPELSPEKVHQPKYAADKKEVACNICKDEFQNTINELFG